MFDNYTSLSLSDDGSMLVDEFITPILPRRDKANLIPLASLAAHPRDFIDEWLGAILLVRMTVHFQEVCTRYALRPTEAQTERLSNRLQITALGNPPTRPEHLRLFIGTGPDRLQVTRERPTGTIVAASLLLAELALSARDAAARTVGRCALDQLAVLHPDAFSW